MKLRKAWGVHVFLIAMPIIYPAFYGVSFSNDQEGTQILRNKPLWYNNPEQLYGYYLMQIDETVESIEKTYKRDNKKVRLYFHRKPGF